MRTWLQHWQEFSKQAKPNFCPALGCVGDELVGAHVKRADSDDGNVYIYPLCEERSQSGVVLDVDSTFKLVSANKKGMCE